MNYGYTVYKACVEDEVFWVAESRELKGCVAQGDTPEEAIAELASNEEEWLETAKECGIEIPEHSVEELVVYSGKFMTRLSPFVHQEAAMCAKKQGISLNQYVNNAIVQANTGYAVASHFKAEVNKAIGEMRIFLKNIHALPQVNITQSLPYSPTIQAYEFVHTEC